MPRIARSRFWSFVIEHSLLLVVGTAAALLWANLEPTSYGHFSARLRFAVNDVGMVFFFALAAKEIIEARLPGGALASGREAAVPLLAAVGGMAVPALLYLAQVRMANQPELVRGWAIPCATDIAFSYLVARLIFPKNHPAIPFLLLLAIADDALGLVLLAIFYPSGPLALPYLVGLMIPALLIASWFRRRRVRSSWAYTLVAGSLSWAALYLGGLHPALALVPIIPFMPHATRDLGFYREEERALPDTMNRFERVWEVPVQVILLGFGLANGGVLVSSIGPATWIVLSSLAIGKPVGIVLMTFLAVRFGLRPPGGLSYRHTAVLGVAAAIGFTVALFFATAAFPAGEALDQAKMGALLSFVAFPLAVGLGRAVGLRPGTGAAD